MFHDCYVSQDSVDFKCWLNSDGSLYTNHNYGNEYSRYDK